MAGASPADHQATIDAIAEHYAEQGTAAMARWIGAIIDAAASLRDLYVLLPVFAMQAPDDDLLRALGHATILAGAAGFVVTSDELKLEAAGALIALAGAKTIPRHHDVDPTSPFPEAYAEMRARAPVTRKTWDRMVADSRQRAFTAAGLAKKAAVRDVHAALMDSLSAGEDLRDFRRNLRDKPSLAGWLKPGKIGDLTPGSPWHVETIFRTGAQTSYGRAQAETLVQPAAMKSHPVWQIQGVRDANARATHRALFGVAIRADDPAWRRAGVPPWGFNCRCRIVAQRDGTATADGSALDALPDKDWSPTLPPSWQPEPSPPAKAKEAIPVPEVPTPPLESSAPSPDPSLEPEWMRGLVPPTAAEPIVERVGWADVGGIPGAAEPPTPIDWATALAPPSEPSAAVFDVEALPGAATDFGAGYKRGTLLKRCPGDGTADQHMRQTARDVLAATTKPERSAIQAFCGPSYAMIRHEEAAGMAGRQSDAILKACRKVAPHKDVCWRGVTKLPADAARAIAEAKGPIGLGRALAGATTSASWDVGVAVDEFAGGGIDAADGTWRVIMRIQSKTGIPIESVSQMPLEREILFSREARFVVDKVERVAGQERVLLVHLQEI